jgi:hypothetical protein
MSTSVRRGFVSVDSKFRFDAGSFSFSGLILVLFVGGSLGKNRDSSLYCCGYFGGCKFGCE